MKAKEFNMTAAELNRIENITAYTQAVTENMEELPDVIGLPNQMQKQIVESYVTRLAYDLINSYTATADELKEPDGILAIKLALKIKSARKDYDCKWYEDILTKKQLEKSIDVGNLKLKFEIIQGKQELLEMEKGKH